MADGPINEIPWTGERLVPSCHGQVLYEHLHRYALAVTLAQNKRVLDIACGEGYGSNLIAAVADQVIGIDIDVDVIRHAAKAYRRENLIFRQGSCLEIPLEDHTVDLVVSFETIEHIHDHERFLREIKRVLTSAGSLLISSPDKREYTDRTGSKNPFHQMELYHEDFLRLLKRYFKDCRSSKQRMMAGSWIAPDSVAAGDIFGTFSGDIRSVDFQMGVRSGVYSIAVCSDVSLPALKLGVFENRRQSEGIWSLLDRYITPENIQNSLTALERSVGRLRADSKQSAKLLRYANQRNEAHGRLIAQLEAQLQTQVVELHKTAQRLATVEARTGEVTAALNRQAWATKKLARLLDDVETATNRLRSSRRWKIGNPIAYLRALLLKKPELAGYGHLEKIVSAYSELRASHSEIEKVDDAIRALKRSTKLAGEAPLADKRPFEPELPSKAIAFPVVAAPHSSIVIPVFNQVRFTQACLASIQDYRENDEFEVIVVDDCSTDGSAEVLANIPGIRYFRNEVNLGFVHSCNAGAKHARGSFLVFLNNDTTVTRGWLSQLRETFSFEPEAGLVGSKLIYPDGRLQEAGGIIWRDGSGWNRGKYEDPDRPEFNFLREVDYCSAACLMIRKSIFDELKGFEARYAPGYYEDTDLAFKVRAAGYRVFYQPLSRVIHYEGITGGTDVASGVKKHQQINRAKFAEAWSTVLATKPIAGDLTSLRNLQRHGKRLLVVDHHLPTPDRDSGSVRMSQILTLLHQLGHQITFVPDNFGDIPPYGDQLRKRGIEVICRPYVKGLAEYLEIHGDEFDATILSRCDIASKHILDVRLYAPQSRLIFDTVDLHFLRIDREAQLTQNDQARLLSREKREQEYRLIEECDETWVVSPVEQRILKQDHPDKSIQIVSNIVEVPGSINCFADRRDFLFIGSFQHTPNVDAVLYFVNQIYPLVRDSLSGVKFYVIGEKPPTEIRALANNNIVVTGFQPEVTSFFERVRFSVAPLRFGAGVKGKINQSMGFGVPVVATSVAVEGMCLKDGEDVFIADDPGEFASAMVRLYRCEDVWQRLSDHGLQKTKSLYSPQAAKRALSRLFSDTHETNPPPIIAADRGCVTGVVDQPG